MNERDPLSESKKRDFALVPRPRSELEKAEPGAKRVLSGMVEETLELARQAADKQVTVADTQLEEWYGRGEKYYFGRGVPKDYSEAFKWYRKAAEHGHSKAQNSLGACYERGLGTPKDYLEAVTWYRKAAEQGDDYAQNNFGACYANGIGVPKDPAEALKWYRKSADQGNWLARTNLGLSNEKGGRAPDYLEAVESCRQMAEQGYAPAQCNLGICYEKGQGVRQDFPEAYKLYKLASDQNHEAAANNLEAVVTRMTDVEIVEGERRYREFKATH